MTLFEITSVTNQLLPEPQAGLLNGILFGIRATLDPALKQSLVDSGTLHIIALSGMNISILVSIVDLVLLRIVRRPIANVATVAIIIGFISLVGPSASVIRAAIMGTISLIAVSFGRQNWPIIAWILAVTVMLLLNPLWIGDLSFQLSIMATLGIILFGNKERSAARNAVSKLRHGLGTREPMEAQTVWTLTKREPTASRAKALIWVWKLIEDDLRVTLAAQVFTVPIILFQFHRISLVSPLSNILIGPLIAPIMVLGLALVLGGLVMTPVATFLSWILWVPLTYVILVIEWTARLPWASVQW
jgi:competence protein ComEC